MAITQTDSIIERFDYKKVLDPSTVSQLQEVLDSETIQKFMNLQQDDEDLRLKGKTELESLSWHFIQYSLGSTCVLESPQFPGWLFKCSSQWQKNIRRCLYANQLSEFANSHKFDHIKIPRKAVFPLGDQYIVVAEKLPIVSASKTIQSLKKHPQIDAIAHQLCTLIRINGLSDTHFGNICWSQEQQLTIIDTDSVGEKTSAIAGLKNIMDLTKKCLRSICHIAEQHLQQLTETLGSC